MQHDQAARTNATAGRTCIPEELLARRIANFYDSQSSICTSDHLSVLGGIHEAPTLASPQSSSSASAECMLPPSTQGPDAEGGIHAGRSALPAREPGLRHDSSALHADALLVLQERSRQAERVSCSNALTCKP